MIFQAKSRKTPFLQFRAGRMTYSNGIVTADRRKGCLSFVADGTDVIELLWSGEGSDADVSLPLKKGEVEVQFVEKCTTGRVLLFKILHGKNKEPHFFWLQDKSTENDNMYLETLKSTLASPKKGDSKTTTQSIQLSELKKIIQSISSNTNDISLKKLLHSTKITEALLEESDFYYERIKSHLPENESWDPKDINKKLQSPHISRAISILTEVLKDPQVYRQICRENNLPGNGTGILGFLTEIIETSKKSS